MPIYFLIQEKAAGNKIERQKELETQRKKIVTLIVSLQASILVLFGITDLLLWLYTQDITPSVDDWYGEMNFYSYLTLQWFTLCITIWAGFLIRKWKNTELGPHGYRWNCKDEGMFTIFWIAQILSLIVYVIYYTHPDSPYFYQYPVWSALLDIFEVVLPALIMMLFMVKMSFSNWSKIDDQ